ncbi:hypothetical protein D3P08_20415 [Paenibacillus nanensis]|uniref:Uncharacterized protein n=1 Tax=Paenibacillus nanensis TaxID=393251 RepID=A0A3A1UY20_9BACL|nr:hypothetical protein D3P08_20415 [Paenibacillus nanensis]
MHDFPVKIGYIIREIEAAGTYGGLCYVREQDLVEKNERQPEIKKRLWSIRLSREYQKNPDILLSAPL